MVSEEFCEWSCKTLAAKLVALYYGFAASSLVFSVLLALCECKGGFRVVLRNLALGTRGIVVPLDNGACLRGNSAALTLGLLAIAPQALPVLWWLNAGAEVARETRRILCNLKVAYRVFEERVWSVVRRVAVERLVGKNVVAVILAAATLMFNGPEPLGVSKYWSGAAQRQDANG